MAELGKIELPVILTVSDETLERVLKVLDIWQEANPGKMVGLVPAGDRYQYEVIELPEGHRIGKRRE